jgi:hypothetical protein
METIEKVKKEMQAFRTMLPELLKKHPDKWVVVEGGKLSGVFEDEETAHSFALEEYGPDGGFIVAPVAEENPTPLNIALVFGTVG